MEFPYRLTRQEKKCLAWDNFTVDLFKRRGYAKGLLSLLQ